MVKISVIDNKPTKDLDYSELKLKILDVSVNYVNALKRILYEYIPTYAFNEADIILENTNTFLDNTRLRERFKFLPILNIKNNIDYLEEKYYKDINFENNERLKHPKEQHIDIVFKDYNKKEEHKAITTNNIKYYVNGKEEINPYNNKYPFLFCYLRNGEHISCVLKSSLSVGLNDPIYQPVYHTYYYEEDKGYVLVVHSKGQDNEKNLLLRCCKVAKILLENKKKNLWDLLHEENIYNRLIYEYKQYQDPEDIKNITFENFTLANIICEELQNDIEHIEFAGVYKENYFDKVVHLKLRFKEKNRNDNDEYKIIIEAIDKCIKKFDEIEKEINKI